MYSPDFELVRDNCTLCKKCSLFSDRLNVVFGQGNENADILILGDAPSGNDEIKGIAFSSGEGEILRKFFALCNIDGEKDVFITNILKCQPQPEADIQQEFFDSCLEHLRNQVRIIKPKIIVCLGERTARKMIDPSFVLDNEHGKFIKKGKLFFIATYHPSQILEDTEKREVFLSDFQILRNTAVKTGIIK